MLEEAVSEKESNKIENNARTKKKLNEKRHKMC